MSGARIGLVMAALSLTSCGGVPRFERPACEQRYRDCTDACADRCETLAPVDDSRRAPTLNDNDLGYEACSACVSECRDRAERCEAAAPPVAP